MSARNVQTLLIAEIWKTKPEIGQCNMSPTAQQYEQQATDTFTNTPQYWQRQPVQ
jgi:hypothetical protein